MLIHISRIIETPTIRYCLARTIDLPAVPQAGWFLVGIAACATAELTVERVGWNAGLNTIECILQSQIIASDSKAWQQAIATGNVDRYFSDYFNRYYGPQWNLMRVFLSLDGLQDASIEINGHNHDNGPSNRRPSSVNC